MGDPLLSFPNIYPVNTGEERYSGVVQSRQDGGFYPTRGRVAQNERDRERDEELNGECSVLSVAP